MKAIVITAELFSGPDSMVSGGNVTYSFSLAQLAGREFKSRNAIVRAASDRLPVTHIAYVYYTLDGKTKSQLVRGQSV